MNTVRPSLGSSHLSDHACDGLEQVRWVSPNVDVTSPPSFGQRHRDQGVSCPQLEPGHKRRGSLRGCNRLLVFEPMADAPAKELGKTCELRLVSAELRLEVARAGSFVLEQTVKRQANGWHGHGDRGI